MKKILLAITLIASLAGCSGFDKNACRESVVKQFNTQNVVEVKEYRYVVKDNQGNLWYVEVMNGNDTNITKKIPIFFGEVK